MVFRNNMRRNDRNNFDRNNYGGSISRNVNPWDNGMGRNGPGNGLGGGNGGGGGGGGGGNNGGGNMMQQNNSSGLNADALSLANSLISNLLRNQNNVPSLMDLPPNDMRQGGGIGGGGGNNNGGGGGHYGGYRDYHDDYDRFDDNRGPMGRPVSFEFFF